MTKNEALKLALEALEWNLPVVEDWGGKDNLSLQHKAITAIREALAQPEQEPVAIVAEVHMSRYTIECTNGPLPEGVPLYTTPPQRKPLTDEEIEKIWWETKPYFDKHDFTRAIEQAHGIKE